MPCKIAKGETWSACDKDKKQEIIMECKCRFNLDAEQFCKLIKPDDSQSDFRFVKELKEEAKKSNTTFKIDLKCENQCEPFWIFKKFCDGDFNGCQDADEEKITLTCGSDMNKHRRKFAARFDGPRGEFGSVNDGVDISIIPRRNDEIDDNEP